MNFSTPYLVFILAAHGVSFFGMSLFLGVTLFQWKKSVRQLMDVSRET